MNYPTQTEFMDAAAPGVRGKIAAALLAVGAMSVALPTQAALPGNALLTIDTGVPTYDTNGNLANVTSGSWFGMDANKNGAIAGSEKTPIAQGTAGLVLGVTTLAGASHTGPVTAGDTNAITAPWAFFGNTGSDFMPTVAPSVLSSSGNTATVGLSGWTVTWNGIPAIPMGTGAWGTGFSNGQANVTCTSTCAAGETYTLDYHATVPLGDPSGFGGVGYALHLEGTVVTSPKAKDDSSVTTVDHAVDINVLANDAAPNGIDRTSVNVVSPTAQGGTAVPDANGVVRYTPPAGFGGPGQTDTFTYTFKDKANPATTSNVATVTVAVHVNTAPTAANDPASGSISAIVGTMTAINVLANDTDPDGNINPASVQITQQGTLGTCSPNADGTITYTAGTTPGSDSCQYTVSDTGGPTPPAASNVATVNVTVKPWSGDWKNPIAAGTVPILMIESGSEFTMQMSVATKLHTPISAGADGGVILGLPQYAAGSHTNAPDGSEVTGVDQAWAFFGNTGMHFTAGNGIEAPNTGPTGDGTLDFTSWRVTWNGIPAINMGGSAGLDSPVFMGKAAIVCSGNVDANGYCIDGSTFTLNYMAHVPPGDPSGFGGVPYGLHLVGHVRFLNTTLASSGTIAPGAHGGATGRVTATDLVNNGGATLDTEAGTPCVGDCFDFTVTNLSLGRAKAVLPLKFGIRPNSSYRKYINGAWKDFDTTTLTNGVADTVMSAPLMPNSGNCPAPGDASYTPGLTAGNHCVQLDIADGGPNDTDATVGTIGDPSGVHAPPVSAVVDTRTTSSSGCSLSADPVSVLKRADWLLLLGFVAWLGLIVRRKRAS